MTGRRTTPAARLDELAQLYERHAYVAWNVALRTALDEETAGAAARRAFVGQVAAPDEGRLALDAGRLAAEAAGGADPRGVENAVLAATVHLAAAQRAALALALLTDAPAAAVAAKLGIERAREQQLRDSAYEQLGVLLGISGDEARTVYADLPWSEPPEELWQALYSELHAAVMQQASAAGGEVPAAVPARRGGSIASRLRRVAGTAAAVLALAGVAWAATGGGSEGGVDPAPDEPTPSFGGGGSYSAEATRAEKGDDAGDRGDAAADPTSALLTPRELDRLRRDEIERLKVYARRKGDRRLPQPERDQAAREVSRLVKLARDRQRAAEQRELALRRQLAREREARARQEARSRDRREDGPGESPAPARQQEAPDGQPDSKPQPREPRKDGGDRVEAECLYDPNAGTYICPK